MPAAPPIIIAMAGNPNSGKTSLFNFMTGSRQHVGNYPGVTVEKKEGFAQVDDVPVTFIDLPGTYSLTPHSPDELVARNEIISGEVSAIIIVVNTTNLERNLYLAAQIIETGKPCVIALNMFDEFERTGSVLNIEQLSRLLGVPCVKTVGKHGKGVFDLMSAALKAARAEIPAIGKPPLYSHEMEHAIERVARLVWGKTTLNERWVAINLLMFGPPTAADSFSIDLTEDDYSTIEIVRRRLEELEGIGIGSLVTAGRYGYASGAVAECLKTREHRYQSRSERIDSLMTNRLLGFPLFLIILWCMFQVTFRLGSYPTLWIGQAFASLGALLNVILPEGFLRSLAVDGIIAGVGGVLIFIPNIMILFFFISILEDSGYMARAAFIMDRVMHIFGLHGKSFIPMIVGFGCTVPAIMATRILENKRDRTITMLILPFMSCGARLPVYILLAGAFFSPKNAGNVIFSLYIVGIILSLSIARIATLRGSSTPFVMELPPYRVPTLRSVVIHIWERAYLYLRKAGTLIMLLSVLVWLLMSYPRQDSTLPGNAPGPANTALENTYAGKLGQFIEPALRPLGLDWRIGVALTAGFAAKEVIVSTLGTVYSIGGKNKGNAEVTIQNALRSDPMFTPVKAYGLMLFILIYVPCIATLSILKRETGGWQWPAFMAFYTTALAWLISFMFIRGAELFL
ncbi:MAG: ferrous iron transport protein B [Candidatus Latescibacter sp.]|nr:ferrous iron transport protein B [Candidatus Latescibacter sp.]